MKIDFGKLPIRKEYADDDIVEKWSCQVVQSVRITVDKECLFTVINHLTHKEPYD